MSEEDVLKYLKMASYVLNSKPSPISKEKEIRRKLSKLDCDRKDELESAFQLYKKNVVQKIINIEKSIDNLKEKIESANSELGKTYQIRINELEHRKIALACRLEEYVNDDVANWNSFKKEFNYELKSFEDELTDFGRNFLESK